jgi:hypothetical protein
MYALPEDLAPSLVERARALLADLSPAVHPSFRTDATYRGPVCVLCHQGGKLGGHHGPDGVEWVHKGCHRKLHRRFELTRTERGRIRRAERRATAI